MYTVSVYFGYVLIYLVLAMKLYRKESNSYAREVIEWDKHFEKGRNTEGNLSIPYIKTSIVSTRPPEIKEKKIVKRFAKDLFIVKSNQSKSTFLEFNQSESSLAKSNLQELAIAKSTLEKTMVIATTLAVVGMIFTYVSYQILSEKKLNSEKKVLQEKHIKFSNDYGFPQDVASLVHEIHSEVYGDSTHEQEAFLLRQKK